MAYAFGGSPLDSLVSGLRASTNAANAGVGAAQSGVNAVLSGGGQVQSAIGNMNAQAAKVAGQGSAVNQTADEVKQTYSQLGPIAALLGGYGGELWNQGNALASTASGIMGQGNALLNMDPGAGGLAGEYIRMWNALSPDRYVSQAASDVQASFANALGQSERELARRGVSASSGAYGALQRQLGTMLATALAAAKTKARQTGTNERKDWLGSMANAANALIGAGNQTQQNALESQKAAVDAQAGSASAIDAQGKGYASVGSLQAGAGDLFAKAATIYGDAGTLQTNYLKLVNDAYGNLASANFSKADAYRQAVSTEVSAVNGGGGGGGGVIIEPAKGGGSDFMNWKGTGHSQTWNKNNLSTAEYNALAAS